METIKKEEVKENIPAEVSKPVIEEGVMKKIKENMSPNETSDATAEEKAVKETNLEKISLEEIFSILNKKEKHSNEIREVKDKIKNFFGGFILGKSTPGNFFTDAKNRLDGFFRKYEFEKDYMITKEDLEVALIEAEKEDYLGILTAAYEEGDKRYHLKYIPQNKANWHVEKTGLTN